VFDFDRRFLKNLDVPILIIYVIITIIGLLAISATTATSDSGFFTPKVQKQIMWILISIVALVIVACLDYNFFDQSAYLLYGLMILMLVAVFVFGTTIKGAKRWIIISGFSMQPSEFCKILLVLSLARLLTRFWGKMDKFKSLFTIAVFVALPTFLVYKQPDLGTSLIYVFIVIIMLFIAEIPWKYVFGAMIGAIALIPVAWQFMADYQRQRILVFFDPQSDPFGSAYNVIQSKTAIGSGNWVHFSDTGEYVYRLFGKGLFASDSMTGLKYIPEQNTDFIFSAIGEGFGFIGSVLVVLLLVVMVYRCFLIAIKAKNLYGAFVVGGLSAMFLFQVLVNIGMTMGLMPVTGLTLPFISAGGSSYLANSIALGIILNIGMRHKKIQF